MAIEEEACKIFNVFECLHLRIYTNNLKSCKTTFFHETNLKIPRHTEFPNYIK